jgi:hypothetical protein
MVFSAPCLRSSLPPGSHVFRSLLIPEIKPTEIPSVFELKVCDVIVGTPQVQYLDYNEHYAPTVDPTTIKTLVTFTCHRNYHIAIIDVSNAFQNTIAPEDSCIYVTVLPTNLSWLCKTENLHFTDGESYVRQMFNSNQGTKDAGNLWYNLVLKVFTDYHLIRSTVDHCLFIWKYDDGTYLYVTVATDDFLCSFATYKHFHDFRLYLAQFFKLTVNIGKVLEFLGIWLIQTEHIILLDQGKYVFEMLETFFGHDVEKVKSVKSPMRHDSPFEKEWFSAPPLTPDELKEISLQYNGGLCFHTGCLQYVAANTRIDIKYATNRILECNHCPTRMAFQCVSHLMRYLAGDPIRPIVFPRHSFNGNDTIRYCLFPGNNLELTVPYLPTIFMDAELTRDLATHHSYFCTMIMVYNVVLQMKIKKTSTVMQHTTEAEMKGAFFSVKQVMPIRQIFAFMGLPLGKPLMLNVDNAAVAAIIATDRMTPRCRHFDIPIALLQSGEKDQTFYANLTWTQIMVADMGTKPNDPQTHRCFKLWAMGAQYLPEKGSEHYDLLQLEYYEMNYADILRALCKSTTWILVFFLFVSFQYHQWPMSFCYFKMGGSCHGKTDMIDQQISRLGHRDQHS